MLHRLPELCRLGVRIGISALLAGRLTTATEGAVLGQTLGWAVLSLLPLSHRCVPRCGCCCTERRRVLAVPLLRRAARLKRCGSIGITLSAQCRWKHRTRPSTC